MSIPNRLLGATILTLFQASAYSATLTDISFKSNGLTFVNDTVVDTFSSPLAFTPSTGLNQPFLNAGDSSITLGYGSLYAIAFLGFGQHLGAGEVSFRLDGGNLITQSVTFPNPASASAVFATFSLSNGDSVTVSATGLSADRIRIVADGGGLQTDGIADAFYQFNFTSAVPEPSTGVLLAGGLALIWGARRRLTRKSP